MTALKQLDAQTAAQHCPTWQGSLRETPPSQPTRSRWKLGAAVAVMRSTWNSNFWVFKLGHRRRALYKNCSLRVLRGRTHFLFRIWVSLCSAIFLHILTSQSWAGTCMPKSSRWLHHGFHVRAAMYSTCVYNVFASVSVILNHLFQHPKYGQQKTNVYIFLFFFISSFLPFFLPSFLSYYYRLYTHSFMYLGV